MQNTLLEFLTRWDLKDARPVAQTGHAAVWKVETTKGAPAALKIYRRTDRGNEAPGANLLHIWNDRGGVALLQEDESAILMEWLDGPSLGDLARSGDLDKAVAMLAETARALHNEPTGFVSGLAPLDKVIAPLFEVRFAPNCPAALRQDIKRAQMLARQLLATQPALVPLHGDLHHDNVIVTSAGLRVIDAKGYLGDPGFELANALRNPRGMHEEMRHPAQITKCLTLYSQAMNVPRQRLAQWSAAKCALSIVWRSDGTIAQDTEADLLHMFLAEADQ